MCLFLHVWSFRQNRQIEREGVDLAKIKGQFPIQHEQLPHNIQNMIKSRLQSILLILWLVVKQLHVCQVPTKWTTIWRRQLLVSMINLPQCWEHTHMCDGSVKTMLILICLDECENYVINVCEQFLSLAPPACPDHFFCFSIPYSIKTGLQRMLFCEWIVSVTDTLNIYYHYLQPCFLQFCKIIFFLFVVRRRDAVTDPTLPHYN